MCRDNAKSTPAAAKYLLLTSWRTVLLPSAWSSSCASLSVTHERGDGGIEDLVEGLAFASLVDDLAEVDLYSHVALPRPGPLRGGRCQAACICSPASGRG